MRHLEAVDVPGSIDLIVADVSFISLRLLLPAFVRAAPHARWLLLVKPQFEVGKEKVGKGGVVREDHLREEAVTSVLESASTYGYALEKRADSRISGPSGNREIFVLLIRRPAENSPHAPA